MLEEPGWRTRYISIYGEFVRQGVEGRYDLGTRLL